MARTVNVVVLFTDVVDSTSLSHRMTAEASDELRRAHLDDLGVAVAAAGGATVKQLGDGVMATFDSATAAMAAAVAMQQVVERTNRGADHAVGLRVGISAGEVSVEDGDVFGDPVVEASRLCGAARGGQILAAAIVPLLAGRRAPAAARDLGEIELKGLPAPVAVVEVEWSPGADDDHVPLPDRLEVLPNVGRVVGYRDELAALDAAYAEVVAGDGRRVVLVTGEAGQGKSTLVAEAARRARAAGACVLLGHCEEHLATPYQLFAEPIAHFARHAGPDRTAGPDGARRAALSRLVPALADGTGGVTTSATVDPETERFVLFGAVVALLADVCAREPLVLILEDLQWADDASLWLLEHVASVEGLARLLVVATYRDDELAQATALRAAIGRLHRLSGVGRVALDGLGDEGVAEFVSVAAGYELNVEELGVAHKVFVETDGNPFFVHQILRHLLETGTIFQDEAGRWVTDGSLGELPLPTTIREVVAGRVALLGERAARALDDASVVGRDFDVATLCAATGLDEDALVDALTEAAAVALVREHADQPGQFSFAHALIQHTLYERLGPTRRARAHRRIAEAIESICGDEPAARAAELARHFAATGRDEDRPRALRHALLAGDAALAALAPADALESYRLAESLAGPDGPADPGQAIDLRIGLGTAARQVGDPTFAEQLVTAAERAIALDDVDRLTRAALSTNRGFFSQFGAIDERRVAIYEAALERLGAHDARRALVLSTYCLEICIGSELSARRRLAADAIELARSVDDDAVVVSVLNNVAYPLMVPPLLEETLARTAEAVTRAAAARDPFLEFFALHWRAQAVAQAGDFDERRDRLQQMAQLAGRLNQPMLAWVVAIRGVESALLAGDLELAESAANEALEIGTASGQPDAGFIYGAQLLVVTRQRGALDSLTPVLVEMAESTPSLAEIISGALAIACVEQGRLDEARHRLEAFAHLDGEDRMHPASIFGPLWHAETAIELDDPTFAAPLYDRLAPYAGQWVSAGALIESPVCHYLGGLATVLGRLDEAEGLLARALVQCGDAGARYFRAQSELQLGRLYVRRDGLGDRERARRLLTSAADASASGGYQAVADRTAAALRELG
jgi:class 3 adenylate cyclase/tetratricopeptide (TPR) repeat protein